ncbi:hypothetical protein OVY01_10395 [Robbsia sp. Bb-Pol-6]|uniref:Glycine zipper family protein n=1 Tax=Robbsia betulipollinis TaxID=2981849 RepID=A0ABT3ZNX4_9BURK|nr:hypothetical protein [Robbsia betulipollinis]MCY0387635.1 hypothetical protein [Robbsia betulipollinis]
MSLIVAGRFGTFEDGERAAQTLFANGFVEDDVTLFFVNPRGRHHQLAGGGDQHTDAGSEHTPAGATKGIAMGAAVGAVGSAVIVYFVHWPFYYFLIAAGIGAYIGSLGGAMAQTHTKGHDAQATVPEAPPVRESGVLLAVHVSEATRSLASAMLRREGAIEVENATGRWANGHWSDFNPVTPPNIEKATGPDAPSLGGFGTPAVSTASHT